MINSGDTSWVLMATTLVFFMMPGLALFCGGLVGEKNVTATMAQSYVAIGVVSLLWVVLGYSLAFGNDHWGIIGGFSNVNGRVVAHDVEIPLARVEPDREARGVAGRAKDRRFHVPGQRADGHPHREAITFTPPSGAGNVYLALSSAKAGGPTLFSDDGTKFSVS